MTDKPKYLHTECVGEICVVTCLPSRIVGEQTIYHVGEALFSLFDQGERKILIDFSGVEDFCGFLGKLVALQNRLNEAGGKLVLCHLSPNAYQMHFGTASLKEVFTIQECQSDALREF